MATDLSALNGPAATKRITMDASAGNAEQVTLPSWASAVLVKFRDSGGSDTTGLYAYSGTDGSAIGNDVMPVDTSGGVIYVRANPGEANLTTIYLASDSAGGHAHVCILETQ
jgi:hypothetical protein